MAHFEGTKYVINPCYQLFDAQQYRPNASSFHMPQSDILSGLGDILCICSCKYSSNAKVDSANEYAIDMLLTVRHVNGCSTVFVEHTARGFSL